MHVQWQFYLQWIHLYEYIFVMFVNGVSLAWLWNEYGLWRLHDRTMAIVWWFYKVLRLASLQCFTYMYIYMYVRMNSVIGRAWASPTLMTSMQHFLIYMRLSFRDQCFDISFRILYAHCQRGTAGPTHSIVKVTSNRAELIVVKLL